MTDGDLNSRVYTGSHVRSPADGLLYVVPRFETFEYLEKSCTSGYGRRKGGVVPPAVTQDSVRGRRGRMKTSQPEMDV